MVDPDVAAVKRPDWTDLSPQDSALGDVVDRIKSLASDGLTGHMVAGDFLRRRLVPLQKRSHPAWEYARDDDATRLHPGRRHNLRTKAYKDLMQELFVPNTVSELLDVVDALHNSDARASILAEMPRCNALGIMEEMAFSPRYAFRAGLRVAAAG